MAKLRFDPEPTFKCKVGIPQPGGEDGQVEFIFKHRTKDEYLAFAKSIEGRDDADIIMDMASGWDLTLTFNPENVEKLVQQFLGAPRLIWEAYNAELTGRRLKN